MEHDAAHDFATRWLASWSGNRPETLLAYYADGARYRDPARIDGLKGKDALRKYFVKLLAANPDWVWVVEEVIPTAEGFTLKWKATIPVGDRTVTEYGLDIVEVQGDQITRNEVYFNAAGLR